MTNRQAYNIWYSKSQLYGNWIKPIAFASYTPTQNLSYQIGELSYIDKVDKSNALILDLPQYRGVEDGVALSKLGWVAIPLYNGTQAPPNAHGFVNNTHIIDSLIWGAEQLQQIEISTNAKPAFLLDSLRRNRSHLVNHMYDNSWDIYEHDLPTASFLKNHSINALTVITNSVQKDLKAILKKYKNDGMNVEIISLVKR
ncbi:MAG: hypothetical protein FWF56_05920 [Firmicutes bacterium]|nr:hypothetical protein [Bacillota bacterium]MCL1953902.1 hypothetical protein [Bacillota bacterium]